jgi:hypothetical protein
MERGPGGGAADTVGPPLRKDSDIAQAWRVLGMVNDATRHADAKTGLTLAATGLTSGTLYQAVQSWPHLETVSLVFLAAGAVLLLCAGICAGAALMPRTAGSGGPASLIHFGRIAHGYPDRGTYVTDFAAHTCNREALFQDIATQTWAMAHVARHKFLWCAWAVRSLLLALLAVTASAVAHVL